MGARVGDRLDGDRLDEDRIAGEEHSPAHDREGEERRAIQSTIEVVQKVQHRLAAGTKEPSMDVEHLKHVENLKREFFDAQAIHDKARSMVMAMLGAAR